MISKRFLITFIFMIFSAICATAYEKVYVVIPFKGGGELHTYFYCFNDFSEGKKIAEEIFAVKKYDELSKGKREKMIPVPIGTDVGYYNWAIFCYKDEFWLFENKNGYLWGRGTLLAFPRK